MRRVKITSSFADVDCSHECGEVVELPDKQAEEWVKAGLAVYISMPKVENTMADIPEKRVRHK